LKRKIDWKQVISSIFGQLYSIMTVG